MLLLKGYLTNSLRIHLSLAISHDGSIEPPEPEAEADGGLPLIAQFLEGPMSWLP